MSFNRQRRALVGTGFSALAAATFPLPGLAQFRGVASMNISTEQMLSDNYSAMVLKLTYKVSNLEQTISTWETLGGRTSINGDKALIDIAGILVELNTSRDILGTSFDSVVNHVAFRVPSLAPLIEKLEAANVRYEIPPQLSGVLQAFTPEGDKIEIFENSSASPGFAPDATGSLPVQVNRHNIPVSGLQAHHLHYYLTEGTDEHEVREWYRERFGGIPGIRLRYQAVDYAAINLNFSVNTTASYPTAGRSLDHIGFVVPHLEQLCQHITQSGTRFTESYQHHADGSASASLIDPWGTSIVLTQLPA